MSSPRRVRERAVLPPARHPPVDEFRITREARVGAEPEPLHHARAHAFDQRVGMLDEPQHRAHRLRLLQVERERALAAIEDRAAAEVERIAVAAGRALDEDHVRAHVGEQHPAERRRADSGDFDDSDSVQRAHARSP